MDEMFLVTENLTKSYKKTLAVDSVNIHIRKGAIYGLIGKNGAGKTTIMKMLSGMAEPTSGTFRYVGFEGDEDLAFSRIGALIEAPALMPNLTAYDNLKMKCLAYDVGDKDYIQEKLNLVGLGNVGKKKAGKFSLGMKQRLGIAMALVGEPDFLLLDEPINGLDPQGIVEVRELLTKLNEEKKELERTIEDLKDILTHEERVLKIIRDDLTEIKSKYPSPRKTEISMDFGSIEDEDLIDREDVVITYPHSGYVKRLPVAEYKAQGRGGMGITAHKPKDEDFVEKMFIASTHDDILMFSSLGKVYSIKGYMIPEAARTAKGRAVVNVLQLENGEKIKYIVKETTVNGYEATYPADTFNVTAPMQSEN